MYRQLLLGGTKILRAAASLSSVCSKLPTRSVASLISSMLIASQNDPGDVKMHELPDRGGYEDERR